MKAFPGCMGRGCCLLSFLRMPIGVQLLPSYMGARIGRILRQRLRRGRQRASPRK